MSRVKLRIIHETNPRKYFPALFELSKEGTVELVGAHRYSVVKEWLRAWLKDRTSFTERTRNAFNDLLFRLKVPFVTGETIVMGFAPWDWRILIYKHLAKRNQIIYHTSWHDWRVDNTPRQPSPRFFKHYLRGVWLAFIQQPNVKIVAVTKGVANSVTQESSKASTVIPHAVPQAFYSARAGRSQTSSGLKLLYVGELSEKKGINVLLSLMSELRQHDISLTLVGKGPLQQQIEQQISAQQAEDGTSNIEYLGAIYDRAKLADTMAEHDVLMLLSQRTKTWEELFGIVIIEAVATGCAVIASDHVGPSEIFESSNGAGLFKEDDVEAIKSTLLTMLNDRAQIAALLKQQDIASDYASSTLKLCWQRVLE